MFFDISQKGLNITDEFFVNANSTILYINNWWQISGGKLYGFDEVLCLVRWISVRQIIMIRTPDYPVLFSFSPILLEPLIFHKFSFGSFDKNEGQLNVLNIHLFHFFPVNSFLVF